MSAHPELAFLHTAQFHVETFSDLLEQLAPEVAAKHVVREDLLFFAKEMGPDHPEVVERTRSAMHRAAESGARVVVCTCSTLGAAAEGTEGGGRFTAMRIDRAMADSAAASGGPVLLVATLESTLEPTKALLRSSAARANRPVDIDSVLAAAAWPHFVAGRISEYYAAIAQAVRACLPHPRVIVFAQSSMHGAVPLLADCAIPVLTSPALGVQADVAALG